MAATFAPWFCLDDQLPAGTGHDQRYFVPPISDGDIRTVLQEVQSSAHKTITYNRMLFIMQEHQSFPLFIVRSRAHASMVLLFEGSNQLRLRAESALPPGFAELLNRRAYNHDRTG